MADVVSPYVRSRMMSGIKGKHTKPEVLVRRALHAAGYRFRLHRKDLPGAPDVVLPARKVAIFANGCFWHMHAGCRNSKLPATRPDFWRNKLLANVERDGLAVNALLSQGWRVLTVWECATRDAAMAEAMPEILSAWIEGDAPRGDIGVA